MYNIIQLNKKELQELQEIATEFNIKNAKSYEKRDLIYQILDAQAIAGSQKAAEKEAAAEKKQRNRINKTGTVSKVYSANQDKGKKFDDIPQTVAKPAENNSKPEGTPEAEKKQDNAPKQPSTELKPKVEMKKKEKIKMEEKKESQAEEPKQAVTPQTEPALQAVETEEAPQPKKKGKGKDAAPQPKRNTRKMF